jgi:hypothetical protein
MKKIIIILITTILPILAFDFSYIKDGGKAYSNTATDSLSIDTSYVLNLLKLTSSDSIKLHLDINDNNYLIDEINRIDTKNKTGDISTYFMRSILSAVYSDSDYSVTGSFLILYVNAEKPNKIERIFVDSIEIYYGGLEGVEPQIFFGDLNFDGYKDFYVSFVENTVGGHSINSFYLFNPDTHKFAESSTMHFESMSFDEDAKEISTGGRIGAISYWEKNYRWNGSKYELYAKENTDYNEDASLIISTREELINGDWKIIRVDTTINK